MDCTNETLLLNNNKALVIRIVNRFKPKNENDFQDYMSAGNVGLLNAIRKHDPTRGKLSTLAWYCITREIILFLKGEQKHYYTEISNNVPAAKSIDINDYLPDIGEQEKRILQLRLEGYSFNEISSILGQERRRIYCIYLKTIKRIRLANV